MINFYNNNKKTLCQLASFAVSLLCVYIFLKYVFSLVAPFIVAFLLSQIISGPVDFISKKSHIPRAVSTAFSMIIILLGLGAVLNLFFSLLTKQALSFAGDFPNNFNAAVDFFSSSINGLQQSYYSFFEIFPVEVTTFFESSFIKIIPAIISDLGRFAKTSSVSVVKILPQTVIFIIITLIATFFITKDKDKIYVFLKRQLPVDVLSTYRLLKDDLFAALWGYIKAQLILMTITGSISIIGLSVLGYTYSLLVGITIALFDALPVFGAGFILWPWALYCVLSGHIYFATGLFILYVVIILCRQLTEPKILSSQIGLYPLVTLGTMYIGLMLFGPIGILIGPVFAITVKSLQKAGMLPDFK